MVLRKEQSNGHFDKTLLQAMSSLSTTVRTERCTRNHCQSARAESTAHAQGLEYSTAPSTSGVDHEEGLRVLVSIRALQEACRKLRVRGDAGVSAVTFWQDGSGFESSTHVNGAGKGNRVPQRFEPLCALRT